MLFTSTSVVMLDELFHLPPLHSYLAGSRAAAEPCFTHTLRIVDIDGNIEGKHCHPSGPQSYLHWFLNIQLQSDRPSQWCPDQDESDKSMLNLGRISISKRRCSSCSVATIYL